MADTYNPKDIEGKWQKYWEDNQLFAAEDFSDKPKRYVLDMFPYPSGAGLHVGHPEGYTATDIYSRFLRMQGFNVLHPMGWDAFGLPAENYAIKTGTHPRVTTQENIDTFRRQIKALGFSYDWNREIDTTDPKYYKWTQWIFLQLFKKGLAYEAVVPINWCPSCKTGLANEEVQDGKCVRCGTPIERKDLRQWMLKITAYADRLLNNLDTLDWSESIKTLQRNWIGRSEGAEVTFTVAGSDKKIVVYTTRPDTLFGATYMVLAPEHSLVQEMKDTIENFAEVEKYITDAKNKSDLERTDLAKNKTGVELRGIKAINPVNNKEIPIWISDYVLASYGTGAIMAVPAHDERDYEFAKKFDLPIIQVIAPFFSTTSGKDAIRADKETVRRKTVNCIVKHWKEDKYLGLDWEKYNWKSFIIGGIEDSEDAIVAAQREIQEETGYKNMKFIRQIGGKIHTNFYAEHKGINRYAEIDCFYFELTDGEHEELDAKELDTHKPVWVDKSEVSNFINLGNHSYFWDLFVNGEKCFSDYGVVINSGKFDDMKSEEAKDAITEFVGGKKTINYKLRDWVFARQRYWGEPIPLVHCEKCGTVPIPESELPLLLPEVEKYEPSGTGESPLATIDEWVNTTCPVCGGPAKRETNTMPQWAGSSWYFLRYIDPKNDAALADSEKMKYWLPVDVYVGGAEHAVLHLLYARFWNMVLFDIGVVPVEEPFAKLVNQGMILGEDGEKMSKSRGNVINPDDILNEFGADAFRMYEMFMGPFEDVKPWSTKGMTGVVRFLEKTWNIFTSGNIAVVDNIDKELEMALHKTIKKVTEDIEGMRFNTAISQMMILSNVVLDKKMVNKEVLESWLKLLSLFAPHMTEELWHRLGHETSITKEVWPKYDELKMKEDMKEFVVQINGKVRAKLQLAAEATQDDVVNAAKQNIQVQKYLEGQEIKKVVFVPWKLIGFVI